MTLTAFTTFLQSADDMQIEIAQVTTYECKLTSCQGVLAMRAESDKILTWMLGSGRPGLGTHSDPKSALLEM